MPSAEAAAANLRWVRAQGYPVTEEDLYVAPQYARAGPLTDPELLRRLEERRPRIILVALSGTVQERLGWGLRQQLSYRPAILCIGGAIAFLSGEQAPIPTWADRLALGWLFRFAAQPRAFTAKVREVWRLPGLIRRYGAAPVREA
jgi:UDP-N-acetyl-D-mannosaminuronic acid transferase (WecB/TagA/CpsF family)